MDQHHEKAGHANGGGLALVCLHEKHYNKTLNDRFSFVEASAHWRSVAIELTALVEHVCAGKAWLNCNLTDEADGKPRNGKRGNEFFACSNLIVLDLDGDLDLDDFWAIPLVQRHCAFTYTSCSHGDTAKQEATGSPSSHRFRAVFPCERTTDAEIHGARYRELVQRLGLELRDSSGAKPAQPWYGNSNAEVRFGQAVPLGWEFSDDAAQRLIQERLAYSQPQGQRLDDGLDTERAAALLEIPGLIRESHDGEYPYWADVFNAAAAWQCDRIYQAFLCWHQRGYHSVGSKGKPPQRVDDKRWSGAGKIKTEAGLFALAKREHGEDWWRLLPQHLWFQPPPPQNLARGDRRLAVDGAFSAAPEPEPINEGEPDETCRELAAEFILSCSKPASEQPRGGGKDQTPGDPPPAWGRNPRLNELLGRLYDLRAKGTIVEEDIERLVPIDERSSLDRQLLGELLDYKGYCNTPTEVERDLLHQFRVRNNLLRNPFAPVQSKILDGSTGPKSEWLVHNWVLARMEHIFYSKAGVGKTILSIALARAILGDPTLGEFLDSGPISCERYGQSRVLYIATDMADSAEEVTNTYIEKLGVRNLPFLRYIDWWMEDRSLGTPAWQLSLPHMVQLIEHLRSMKAAGTPVTAVIIDSMKAVCPAHLLVGQQAFADYLRLVYDICTTHGAALVWIHHTSKDGTGAQGIQRITEGAAAVIRMERDGASGRVVVDVEKIRGGGVGRKLLIDPFAKGAPALLSGAEGESGSGEIRTNADHRAERILRLLEVHLAEYRVGNPEISGAALALDYGGMAIREIAPLFNDSISHATLKRDLERLVGGGALQTTGYGRATRYRLPLDQLGNLLGEDDAFTSAE